MDLNRIAIFTRVVEAGSFTEAARQLGMPKTSVSRRVAELESELGVRLLHRTTRSLRTTDAGRQYYERSSMALREIESANQQLAETRAEPAGTIRVSAPVGFAGYFLADTVFAYLAAYPGTRVELVLTDEKLNLVDSGIDLSFRTGSLPDSSLVARKLGSTQKVLCASPDYLARRGVPTRLAELSQHDCIIAGDSIAGAHWDLEGPDGHHSIALSGRFAANMMELAYLAAVHGYGIAQLPTPIAAPAIRAGTLRRVLRKYASGVGGLYAVFPSNRHLSPAVKAFVEIAARHIADASGVDQDWTNVMLASGRKGR